MKKLNTLFTLLMIFSSAVSVSQPWVQNDAIFNPSGIPSLPFSQPRFADIDDDGDADLIIGSIDDNPLYLENVGSNANPIFEISDDIFSIVEPLDAEMGVCKDIDGDGDLDFITGGFTGLNLYLNTGTATDPEFEKVTGFFDGINVGQNPIPDLADIDNDGDPDMVVGYSESGLVKIYTNTGTSNAAEFSESSTNEVGDVGLYAYPTFCDVDGDDDQDLVVGRDGHGFVYYKNNGDPNNAIWEIDTESFEGIGNETYWNSLAFADLTADDRPDLVFGNASGPLNYYIQSGTPTDPVWSENTTLFGGILDVGGASNPCFFDFDGDGDQDMFTGTQLGDIKYYKNTGTASGPSWEENNEYFTSLKHSIYSAVAVGDVNDDELPDAIVGDLSGNLYYHRNILIGFELISDALQGISLGAWSAPCLADMDNDGDLDIVAGNENGNLHYIENQGSAQIPDWVEIPSFFAGIDVGTNCVPAVVDIDYDEDLDIVCGNFWGDLYCYINDSGEWIDNSEILDGISGEQNTTPAFADLDNDGDPDLAMGQYNGTFNYFRNQYLIIGLNEHQNYPKSFIVSIFPNPCTETATIRYYLHSVTNVKIEILSSSGKKIMEQNWGKLKAGYHSYRWNASTFPEGMYFIKINIAGSAKILKVVKM